MAPTDIQAHETKPAPFVNQDSPLAQLEQILDSMQDAIMAISLPDHRLIYKSASFERVFGYPVQKFVDDPSFFKQVVHPDDLGSAVAAQAAALRDGCIERARNGWRSRLRTVYHQKPHAAGRRATIPPIPAQFDFFACNS